MNEFNFKIVNEQNVFELDPTLFALAKIFEQEGALVAVQIDPLEWVRSATKPQLDSVVPFEIQRLFEVAKGAIAYGVFFHPLFQLGSEQLFRVMEAAARKRAEMMRQATSSFRNAVEWLSAKGVISREERTQIRWRALVDLRNEACHPEDQQIAPPNYTMTELQISADLINGLFNSRP